MSFFTLEAGALAAGPAAVHAPRAAAKMPAKPRPIQAAAPRRPAPVPGSVAAKVRPLPVEKKPVATAAAEEWEEF